MTAPGRSYAEAGVSLIEVLAALTIVAVMGASVVVMADTRRTPLDLTADRLTRALGEARLEALLSGEVVGFGADADFRGWRFYTYQNASWRVIDDHPALSPARMPDDVTLEPSDGVIPARGEAGEPPAPQVWFDPAGFDAPFSYVLRLDGATRSIGRRDDGRIQLGPSQASASAPVQP